MAARHRRSRSKSARAAREQFYSSIPEDELDAEAFRMGQMAALEGMDLPDGAYLAMADEMGLDPFDYDEED
jgi:hypothetical protein